MEFLTSTQNNNENTHFVWSHTDAFSISTHQIGQSACGATAIVNACQALNIVVAPKTANEAIGTRLRKTDGSLLDYIKARSDAGATHMDFIRCVTALKESKVLPADVEVKFYNYLELMQGKPVEMFTKFCLDHLRNNSSLILTMNLQKAPVKAGMDGWIADAWHHQTVYGIEQNREAFWLTNPLEMKDLRAIDLVLNSASELLIREDDICKFIDPCVVTEEALQELATSIDDIAPAWKAMEVGANFLKIVADHATDTKGTALRDTGTGYTGGVEGEISVPVRRYLRIPAAYQPGVTVISRRNS